MEYLYLYLVVGAVMVPLIFSFHPKIKFYREWKYFFPATAIMMAIFIPWDVLFTQNEIWGFNDNYITGYKIVYLPIEEWLFFISISYCCIFTYFTIHKIYPSFSLTPELTKWLFVSLQTILLVGILIFYDRWYTLVNFAYAAILLGFVYNFNRRILLVFFPVFLLLLIPFFIINGVLTGTGIIGEVVWYNNAENLNLRIGTVPIEDIIYALGMLLTVVLMMEWIKKWMSIKNYNGR